MAIKSSGTFLKFSEIASEFNDSQPHSMSEFTQGGSLVPAGISNLIRTQAQRNAGGANGRMRWSDYYGASNVLDLIISGTLENLNLQTFFDTNTAGSWASGVPKTLTIASTGIIGATTTANAALIIPSGMGGTLTIINNGSIQGAGGAANGGAGGTAVSVASTVTITNNGTIYGGGGGGGQGGTGGRGGNGATLWPSSQGYTACSPLYYGSSVCYNGDTACTIRGYSYCGGTSGSSGSGFGFVYECSDCILNNYLAVSNSGGYGGAGGNGGAGVGYNNPTAGNGIAGAAGTAPTWSYGGYGGQGGTGGSGGGWGTVGNTGNTGFPGQVGTSGIAAGGGYAGSTGGAAGNYISGISNVTFTNNGTVLGTTS